MILIGYRVFLVQEREGALGGEQGSRSQSVEIGVWGP